MTLARIGTFSERIEAWIKREKAAEGKQPRRVYFELVEGPATLVVNELNDKGKAEVRCEVLADHTCVQFNLHGNDGLFGFLRESSNADGAFLLEGPDGVVTAWIVECKRTLGRKTWGEVLKQFRWTVARLFAVAGVIGVEVGEVALVTAFREDLLSPSDSPNPAFGKLSIGDDGAPGATEGRELQRLLLAWLDDNVHLGGFQGGFRHTKLQLDDRGCGAYTLLDWRLWSRA